MHFFFAPLMRFSFLFTHTISRMNWSGGVEMFFWKCGRGLAHHDLRRSD